MSAQGPVLAVLDDGSGHRVAELAQPAAELLTTARRVAIGLGSSLEAVWSGPLDDDGAARLGEYGVDRVHHLVNPATSSTELADALGRLAATIGPAAILATTSFASRELAARLGYRLGGGVLVDASRLDVVDGQIEAHRTAFAATWGSRCAVVATPAIITVKPHAASPEPAPEALVPQIVALAPGAVDPRVRVVERTQRVATGRPDLASAAVVVAGGRGTEGDFTLLTELADLLGGAVGATRVASDEGWVGHELQVGQTGVTVNPVLYIGAGISGAVHHVGGMRAAQSVVSINTDPDAPLNQVADYVVVGDLFEVVGGLIARLRELREAR